MLDALKQDPDLSATVIALESTGELRHLVAQIREVTARRELCQMFGSKLNADARAQVEPRLAALDLNGSCSSTWAGSG